MNKFFWISGIATVLYIVSEALKPRRRQDEVASIEHHEGFTITRTPLPGNQQIVRFRGSYDDIMRSLGIVDDEKPQLPEDLDIEGLREYFGGCPHCGEMSLVGENVWRYQELSRTRGFMNNTTTYLARCKKCSGFMKYPVDHDD